MDGVLAFWTFLVLSIWGYSLRIVIKQNLFRPFGIIAILMSLFPMAWVAFDCYQKSSSEACVWGKSLIILYIGFTVIFVAPIIFLIYYFSKKTWNSFKAS